MPSKPPRDPDSSDRTPDAADSENGLVTSEDLFGDIIDAPLEASPGAAAKRGPIKVRVPEPGKAGTPEPAEPLPDEFSVLLDAFGDDRRPPPEGPPAAARVPPEPPAPAPEARPAPPERPPVAASPAPTVSAAELADSLFDSVMRPDAPSARESTDAGSLTPPEAVGAAPPSATPAGTPAAPAPPPPSPRRPPTPAIDVTGGDFALDLSELAEHAFAAAEGERTPVEPEEPAEGARKPTEEGDFGPYHLLERVARGGMAEVFKAKRTGVEGFEKIVAVKRILPHLSDNREFVEMFVNEAKLVAGLTHPNIVQIFDLGALESSYFIAMEYVQGRDLRSIQKRAAERDLRIPMDLSALVINRVCLALEFAHRKKDDEGRALRLVHRDISPQNILISFEGDVKLTDFGIAKAAAKASTTDGGALRGKILYMSPEQAKGKALDRRSDIFSLGVVFYELLAGQKPFQRNDNESVLETVRQCRIIPLATANPRVPPDLQRIVSRALEKDPEDRYQNAAEMHRDVDRVLHERQAPTSAELARFLELIFDQAERGEPSPPLDTGDHGTPEHLEVDVDSGEAGMGRATGATGSTDPHPEEIDADRTAPGIPRERSELRRLLDRLRWK